MRKAGRSRKADGSVHLGYDRTPRTAIPYTLGRLATNVPKTPVWGRLVQIPISHNCVKVRRALQLKHLEHDTLDISPVDRSAVRRISGQGLVPVLEDGDTAVADSTAILAYLEGRYPDPPLLPPDPRARAECWLLEDWADEAFMERTRRIGYWRVLHSPGGPAAIFRPRARGLQRWILNRAASRALRRRFRLSERRNRQDEEDVKRLAGLAMRRIGDGPFLMGETITVADVTLAAMSAPLAGAAPEIASHAEVRALLGWGEGVLGRELVEPYRRAVKGT